MCNKFMPPSFVQAILKIATEEHAKLFVPVSIAQYSVYEALAADLLARSSPFLSMHVDELGR